MSTPPIANYHQCAHSDTNIGWDVEEIDAFVVHTSA